MRIFSPVKLTVTLSLHDGVRYRRDRDAINYLIRLVETLPETVFVEVGSCLGVVIHVDEFLAPLTSVQKLKQEARSKLRRAS